MFMNWITIVTDLIEESFKRQSLPSNQYTEEVSTLSTTARNGVTSFTGASYLQSIILDDYWIPQFVLGF